MQKAYWREGDVIVINRDLTELDLFVRDFLSILKRHSDYLIVSGFVSIATGRARATEDVDILVPRMGKDAFNGLFGDLQKSGFWCYQGDTFGEVFSYFQAKDRTRFARLNQLYPNSEIIPIDDSNKLQYFEFTHPTVMRVGDFEFKVPPIEFEILYKELMLGSEKDIADAKHLREFFSELIRAENFKKFESMIKGHGAKKQA
ncbi:hypothetical protein HYU15_02625 [Candidatus Woesearchaeota archaeon]|nr:hypothetical protein [Candidatus Woesearchaeota archaeon]